MNQGLGRGGCRIRWRRRSGLRLSSARGLMGDGVAARKLWLWQTLWIRILVASRVNKAGPEGDEGLSQLLRTRT
jgi:hypothetical protein